MPKLLKKIEYEILAVPAFILFTIFCVLPIVSSMYYSFTDWNGISQSLHYIGLSNYIKIFQDTEIVLPAIKNTLVYALSITVLVTIMAVPLAVILNAKLKSVKWLRAVFFFPSVPSALIIGFIWSYILVSAEYGPMNIALNWFGIEPINWLGDRLYAKLSIIMVSLWQAVGWHAVLYIANLQTIPEEYYESAQIDGANVWQKFRFITIPMLAPAFSISILFLLTSSFKLFDLPFALTNGGPGHSTYYIVQTIYSTGIIDQQFGRATALSIVLFIFILVVSLIQLKATQKWEDQSR